ncbi:helix-turn-helix domain-containing protein [Martelella alba]|uniref:Helix-turn-helix domain-containing protein n=1 Tax=Martelella alba TaxID=2590451 RepID=A0ABY2SMS4_9HYPH|nr:helix-turn-helix domain-containing protein [Martelella alba]TKI07192.1 helix-turn-helix domain-containing protein [Martelella alba]
MSEYRIKALRLSRAWSQEHLAELSSLSIRTIQRIENGEQASLETLAAIAAAFDMGVTDLYAGQADSGECQQAQAVDEKLAKIKRQIAAEARFYRQMGSYTVISLLLMFINAWINHGITWSAVIVAILAVLLINKGLRTFVIDKRIDKWKRKKIGQLLNK